MKFFTKKQADFTGLRAFFTKKLVLNTNLKNTKY